MSISIANIEATAPPVFPQPFQCHVCQKRFTRHENLKRHAAVHSRSPDKASFTCDVCQISFARLDLRHRHMKRKHPDLVDSRVSTKRGQNDAAVARERREASLPKENRTSSISSSDASNRRQPQQPLPQEDRVMDDFVGEMDLPETLRQLQQNDTNGHAGFPANNPPAIAILPNLEEDEFHNVGNWLVQQPSNAIPRRVTSFSQDAGVRYQRDISLEPSSLDSAQSYNVSNGIYPATDSQSVFTDNSSAADSPKSYIPDGLSSKDIPYLHDNWFPSSAQTARGYQLYFTHVSHFIPFIHRPTFDATETARHLGLSMLCLAYQHGEDPDSGEETGSGPALSLRCFHRARTLAASEEEIAVDLQQNITLVQTYWLLEVCSMMYLCGDYSVHGLKMHSRMISIVRFGGLTQSIAVQSTNSEDLDAMWRGFIEGESHKRTLLAVHQIDALWYQLFSIPRSLSHLEIKHDLPCREDYWTANSSGQWAHRQLAAKQSAPLVPYSDAIRLFLSPDIDIDILPTFDIYGAINIAQFLLSSAREVSGWSTMTGRLSMERFEPLRSSLFALERLIRPQGEAAKSAHIVSCEATWEMAMIELLIWSPSHTCGIVGGSVDAFLSQSTYLASSCKGLKEIAANVAVQPHVDWFLRYLERSIASEDSEPPWIALYAYKAFLIAWQLLHEGIAGAMSVVGVRDGDTRGATDWARKVFHPRKRHQLGKLISSCLDILDT